MSELQKNQLHTAAVTGYTAEGLGVARVDGRVVFVHGGVRGEVCSLRILKVRKSVAYARVEEVLERSPARVEPDCPHYPVCGGCDFRHTSYEEELEEFGISKCEDGTLALDAQVLADADLDAMADMFGPGANFAQELERQVTGIAEKTASTVDALQIYSTAYSNSGSYSQYEYLKGIYDIKA